jgi:hypothetical protein
MNPNIVGLVEQNVACTSRAQFGTLRLAGNVFDCLTLVCALSFVIEFPYYFFVFPTFIRS